MYRDNVELLDQHLCTVERVLVVRPWLKAWLGAITKVLAQQSKVLFRSDQTD
jgi:hypothetical protein